MKLTTALPLGTQGCLAVQQREAAACIMDPPKLLRLQSSGGLHMENSVRELFERYENLFRMALADEIDMDKVASSYAAAFVAASPAGVSVGQNDEHLKQVMLQGFENYRRIGTKDMRLRNVRIAPIDEHHCLAHVAWTGIYDRGSEPDISIDFEVHYLVQQLEDAPKIFGWVSGDEQAVLKQHGIT
ncbi:nuclear transport factor 2 family protein [Bradyrhizobium sp. AUGA SZCCT0274]|jgi:hypothetical protein|uniref:nuclear transport factor 2 family protein n=1 Tax=unclassified Bradyrhizobium TaxID=2631580 RepID=UPI0039088A61